MKTKTLFLSLFAIMFLMISASAQTWNKDQLAVWKFVEEYNDVYTQGDVNAYMAYFHDDYKGWYNMAHVPNDKQTTMKYVGLGMKSGKVKFNHLTPLSIQVFDDFAVVHYLFHTIGSRGEESMEHEGRWTDILIKDGSSWKLIADHGGPTGS